MLNRDFGLGGWGKGLGGVNDEKGELSVGGWWQGLGNVRVGRGLWGGVCGMVLSRMPPPRPE